MAPSVKVIRRGVGAVTFSDVLLAAASSAIVIGFHVQADARALDAARKEGVDVRSYNVIYEAVDDIRKAMSGLLEPEFREHVLGEAVVRQVFRVQRVVVAGSLVQSGTMTRNAMARVIRDGEAIFEGKISSLRRFKEDVREVASGFECGIGVEGFSDTREGDMIRSFRLEEVGRMI